MGLFVNNAVSQTPDKPVLLIVDDEQGPRESLRMVFKDRYRCAVATGGKEGVNYARENHVDAAILDIKMPDISGIEVLRELKQIDPHIECVMLTGFETIETARAAVRFGAADYLNKPFDVFAMRDLLDRCLAHRQRSVELERALIELRQVNEQLAAAPGIRPDAMAVITAYARSLTDELADLRESRAATREEIHTRLAALHREVERCIDITRRFIRFSQPRQRETECIDVRRLVEDVAVLLKTHPANERVTITVEAAADSLPIKVNPAEVMQVFLALGVHGLQSLRGGGTLTFAVARATTGPGPNVWRAPSFNAEQPLVRIAVADSGGGLSVAQFATIMAGMEQVGELIERHGGALDTDNQPGQGVTFSVYLPLVA